MKNQGNNQQSHRGNGQKRGNSNVSRNGQSQNNGNKNPNRNTGRGRKPKEPPLWASSASSSTTLTSHLSMVNKRNQDGTGKNTGGTNGTGRSNGKPRSASGYKKNVRTRGDAQNRVGKRYPTKNSAHTQKSPNEVQVTSNASPQRNKTEHNGILQSKTNTFGIDPFELFCAYHLGISSQNQ